MSSDRGPQGPAGEELGTRLGALCRAALGAREVWDIGCDHGQVGLWLGRQGVEVIHLVDPSLQVQSQLQRTIDADIPWPCQLKLYPTKGEELTVTPLPRSCYIIAGMGGEKIASIVDHLRPQFAADARLVLSPHRDIPLVRARLREANLGLIHEELVRDGGRFYEVLVVSPASERPVSPYGEEIWSGELAGPYCQHLLAGLAKHRDPSSEALRQFLTQKVKVLPIAR